MSIRRDFEKCKRAIDDWCMKEFGYGADFSDIEDVGILYTEAYSEDGDQYGIQWSVCLPTNELVLEADGDIVDDVKFKDADALAMWFGNWMDGDCAHLVAVAETILSEGGRAQDVFFRTI